MKKTNPSPFPPGARVAAYLRDSGGDEQDLSVPQQERAIQKWCSENGTILTHIFKDIATPGSSIIGRQEFQRMIQHFRHPDCEEAGVVIWKYSRFSRDIDDAQFFKADLRRRGYTIYSINDPVPDGLDGRFFESAIEWMNARFLEDLSTDVRRGLHDLVRAHGAVPGIPPRGFTREPIDLGTYRDGKPHIVHRWVPDPDTWDRCRQAWEMRARGASYREINQATDLFGSLNSYATFFKNRLYLGELRFGELVISDYAPALVDENLWAAVQAVNERYGHKNRNQGPDNPRHSRRVHSKYLLSGLAYCAECGSPLSGESVVDRRRQDENGEPVRYFYYTCAKESRTRDSHFKRVPAALLDRAVIEAIADEIIQPDMLLAMQTVSMEDFNTARENVSDQRAELRKRLGALRHRKTNLVEAIAAAGHSSTLLESLAVAEQQEREILAAIARLEEEVKTPPSQLDLTNLDWIATRACEQLLTLPVEQVKPILQAFIQRISITNDGAMVRGIVNFINPPAELLEGLSNHDKRPPPDKHGSSRDQISLGAPFYTRNYQFRFNLLVPRRRAAH